MRAAIFLAATGGLGACLSDQGPGDPGFPDPGNPQGSYCSGAGDCPTGICTRDHECLPSSEVRSVMTRWTITGGAASTTSCAALPTGELEISYSVRATGEYTGFAPLRCDEGQFFVDAWPARFDHVRVDVQSQTWSGDADLSSDSTNADVTVDLGPH